MRACFTVVTCLLALPSGAGGQAPSSSPATLDSQSFSRRAVRPAFRRSPLLTGSASATSSRR